MKVGTGRSEMPLISLSCAGVWVLMSSLRLSSSSGSSISLVRTTSSDFRDPGSDS